MVTTIKSVCQAITNIFEVDNPAGNYESVQDIDDDRGWTVTHVGHTERDDDGGRSGNGDLFTVIALAQLTPFMKLKEDRLRFPGRWAAAMADPGMRATLVAASDSVAENLYWKPALRLLKTRNMEEIPYACAVIYDTMVQHGDGDAKADPDSCNAIWESSGGDLEKFLKKRREVLKDPHNKATQAAWLASIGRVAVLESLKGNLNLKGPLQIGGRSQRVNFEIPGL